MLNWLHKREMVLQRLRFVVFAGVFVISSFIYWNGGQLLAAAYYVSTEGSNSEDGSLLKPWASVNYSLSRL